MIIGRKGIIFMILLIALVKQNSHAQSVSGFERVKGTRSHGLYYSLIIQNIENQEQFIQYIHQSHNISCNVSGESGEWFKKILTADIQLSFENTPENSDWIDWPLLYRFCS